MPAEAVSEAGDEPDVGAAPASDRPLLGAGGPEAGVWEPEALHRLEPGERRLVDSMVGQVNGRPVFADAFFEPIEDRLVALSMRTDRPDEFALEAGPIVMAELRQVVLNALYLAEAESGLSVEQQKGLRAFLAQLEQRVIAGHGGSEERARQRIENVEDQSFESHIEGLKDQLLIRELFRTEIMPHVIVSWLDIEREYRRREAEFNPTPTFTLARIRLLTVRDADAIADVERRLAAGESFVELAESLGGARGGIWQTFEVEGGDLSTIEFANDVIRNALVELEDEGDTTGPFELGPTTWWIHVAKVERPPSKSLYDVDVQLGLAAQLRRERGTEEQNKYVDSLLEKGIYDELDGMAQRLLTIAVMRYAPRPVEGPTG